MINLKEKARQIRKDVLTASFEAGACHINSALSCVDILVFLFYKVFKKDDVFIFSKASGVAAYYAILANKGYFPKKKLAYYLKNYPLVSKEVPGVIWSGGSLGMGLPIACGIALGDRTKRVFCLISDAECQEGTAYESALFARHHKLTNLHVICDNNGIQACGKTKDILDLETAFEFLKKTLPDFANIKTIKGFPISFMENDYFWHYKNLTKELLNKALKQL